MQTDKWQGPPHYHFIMGLLILGPYKRRAKESRGKQDEGKRQAAMLYNFLQLD